MLSSAPDARNTVSFIEPLKTAVRSAMKTDNYGINLVKDRSCLPKHQLHVLEPPLTTLKCLNIRYLYILLSLLVIYVDLSRSENAAFRFPDAKQGG